MEKKKENKKIRRTNARWVLVFSCALLACIMATFGLTLAFYGGVSTMHSAELIMRSGIELKKTGGTDFTQVSIDSDYMVPGTQTSATCIVTVQSGTTNHTQTAINGLLRVSLAGSGTMASSLQVSSGPFDVYKGSTATAMDTASNKIGRLVKKDSYWYLVADTSATAVVDTTALFELDCMNNAGTYSIVFNVPITIGDFQNDLVNTRTAKLEATFQVIQSEFYDDVSTDPLTKNYKNAIGVFSSCFG